jgi:5'-AMP-activated protein kinase regulatory gamma subunit
VAPIWDQDLKQFVGMMTIRDFINATKAYKAHHLSAQDFSTKTLSEMLSDSVYRISFCEFQSIDAEDTMFQACSMLRRLECDYLPVLDPDEGNLLATVGYFDVLILIVETARTYPHLFTAPVSSFLPNEGQEVVTTTREAPIEDVLELLAARNVSAVPVVDENNVVVGLYHRDDVTYLVKAADQGSTISNLSMTVGDVLSTEVEHASMNVLCTYKRTDTLLQVLHKCAEARSSRLVCVDDEGRCSGIISVKDLVGMFLES